jgi:hypothetical protein
VDTPGFARTTTQGEDVDTVVDYVESLLYHTASVTAMDDSDVLGLVSGNGGASIDLVIYLLPPGEYIRRLS